jgi:hypothetical protein
VNPKLGLAFVVNPEGPELIWDSGAVTSIANDRDAGVGSMVPASSTARTSNVWAPSERPGYPLGEVHEPQLPESSRHSKVEPSSFEEKLNAGLALATVPVGPESIWVCGATVSTVNERAAGVVSVLPAASDARTSKVWGPSERPA